jgi:branched-chain amino acid transport system ATP-binding protein
LNCLIVNIPEAGYGKKVILKDICFEIIEGGITALIGPNGAGKSTLLKVIIGIVPINRNSILLKEEEIINYSTAKRVRTGISYVPQGNNVFNDLTVQENLEIGGYLLKDKKEVNQRFEIVLSLFPQLKNMLKRDVGLLSGGEKQQLAIARALILQPSLLLLDEPSLGLSPNLVTVALNIIAEINIRMKTTIIIVEQKVHEVSRIAHRILGLRSGEIVFDGTPDQLRSGDTMKKIFLI